MDITTYFDSDDFLEIIGPLGKYCNGVVSNVVTLTKFFIESGINYWRLFLEDTVSVDEMNDFIKNVVFEYEKNIIRYGDVWFDKQDLKNGIYEFYLIDLFNKYNFNYGNLKDEVVNNKVKELIAVKLLSNKYVFHGFNGVFLDSITKYGLNPNRKFEKQSELNKINDLFEKHGVRSILGWQKKNCVGKISYADCPISSYYYAVNSPEWFAHFTGQGFAFVSEEFCYNGSAFARRNYDDAYNNLLMLMEEKKFSDVEQIYVKEFFDKYWDIYVGENSKPMLCIIPNKNEKFDKDYNNLINNKFENNNLIDLISKCFEAYHIDGRTSEVIDTSKALYVYLPELNRVLEKMNINVKNNNIKKLTR